MTLKFGENESQNHIAKKKKKVSKGPIIVRKRIQVPSHTSVSINVSTSALGRNIPLLCYHYQLHVTISR